MAEYNARQRTAVYDSISSHEKESLNGKHRDTATWLREIDVASSSYLSHPPSVIQGFWLFLFKILDSQDNKRMSL